MWIREYLPELAAIATIALWSLLATPLLLRLTGVPISINPRKRKTLKLDLRQNMLLGVVGWGVGMILFGVTYSYITGKLSGPPSDRLTLLSFGGLVLKWTLGGVLFGLFTYLVNGKRSSNQANPGS